MQLQDFTAEELFYHPSTGQYFMMGECGTVTTTLEHTDVERTLVSTFLSDTEVELLGNGRIRLVDTCDMVWTFTVYNLVEAV